MRILFVLEHFYPYVGGAENLFWELTRALVRRGHEVGVVTTLFRKGLPREETIEGVRVRRVHCFNRYFFSFFSLPAILSRTKEYDLIHTTSYNAALPAWIAARLSGKPVLITFHEVWGALWWQLPFASYPQRLAFYKWEKLLLRLPFARFIAVSEFTRRALLDSGVPAARAHRIYNGLDYSEFEAYRRQLPEQFTYTYFGRLGMSKGLDLLLPAAQAFARRHPDSRLKLIIPTYPEAMFRRIMAAVDALGIRGHLILLHNLSRSELLQEISNSSCVVVPSYSEGFCFVAAEAVALGVPLVSSQRGALAEVVSGQYLPMEAMNADSLLAALEKAKKGDWEEKPRAVFTLSDSVEAYLALYDELAS